MIKTITKPGELYPVGFYAEGHGNKSAFLDMLLEQLTLPNQIISTCKIKHGYLCLINIISPEQYDCIMGFSPTPQGNDPKPVTYFFY